MTFGSLFSGVGGMDLGLERAGMAVRWQVEVNEWRRERLAILWPEVRRRGDIRLIDPADLEPVDLICGGFPCQPVSTAGQGRGETDRRWLWPEMLRFVRQLRPCWMLAENVSALRTRGADRVCCDLEAEGYTVWPLVVGAWAVGAPHFRERVWILAHASGERLEGFGDGARSAAEEGAAAARGLCTDWPSGPLAVDSIPVAPDGVSNVVALKALGDAVIPDIPYIIGRAILALESPVSEQLKE